MSQNRGSLIADNIQRVMTRRNSLHPMNVEGNVDNSVNNITRLNTRSSRSGKADEVEQEYRVISTRSSGSNRGIDRTNGVGTASTTSDKHGRSGNNRNRNNRKSINYEDSISEEEEDEVEVELSEDNDEEDDGKEESKYLRRNTRSTRRTKTKKVEASNQVTRRSSTRNSQVCK